MLQVDIGLRLNANFELNFQLEQSATTRSNVLCLLGASGSGKTTVLRALAGLVKPDRGTICFGDASWFDADSGIYLSPQQRRIGYLQQFDGLLRRLTVLENLQLASLALPTKKRKDSIVQIAKTFKLEPLLNQKISTLSGGQRQRVALAQAMLRRPELLLLDEPLQSLDALSQQRTREQLRECFKSLACNVVFVTHDRTDALTLADQVIVLDAGRVSQEGTVEAVFHNPASFAVAQMVGIDNVCSATVVSNVNNQTEVRVESVTLQCASTLLKGSQVLVCFRAEDVLLAKVLSANTSARNQLTGRIVSIVPDGLYYNVKIDCGFRITARVTRQAIIELSLESDAAVVCLIKSTAIHLITK